MATSEPPAEPPAEDSSLVISDEVLAEIAYTEALTTPGIVMLREGLLAGVLPRHGPKGVHAEVNQGEVAVRLEVGVRQGVSIPEAAGDLQRRVAAAIAEKTGYPVGAVDVHVGELVFD